MSTETDLDQALMIHDVHPDSSSMKIVLSVETDTSPTPDNVKYKFNIFLS